MVWELAAPTATLPKLALDGVRLIPACNPVPFTGITVLEPCEFVIVIFPATFSAAVGLNCTFIVWVCPADSVIGSVKPLSVTSFALTVTCEIVMLEFPELVSTTVLLLELPAFTFPKLKLVGLAEMFTVDATPVPLRETVAGEFGAVLVTVTDPVRLPAVVGANTALKVVLAPAARLEGGLSPVTL